MRGVFLRSAILGVLIVQISVPGMLYFGRTNLRRRMERSLVRDEVRAPSAGRLLSIARADIDAPESSIVRLGHREIRIGDHLYDILAEEVRGDTAYFRVERDRAEERLMRVSEEIGDGGSEPGSLRSHRPVSGRIAGVMPDVRHPGPVERRHVWIVPTAMRPASAGRDTAHPPPWYGDLPEPSA